MNLDLNTLKEPVQVKFSIGGFLKLVRFNNLLILVFTQVMTAVFLVSPYGQATAYLGDFGLQLLILSTLSIAAAGYIINDYYDIKIDYINKPESVMVGRVLSRRSALVVHSGLNLIGVAIAFSISYIIGLIHLITTFCLWLYSNQLKRLPFVGNLTVAVLTAISVSVVGIYYGQNQFLVNTYAIFAFGVSLIREIVKDMEDLKGDASFGCKTLPIIWGIRKTKNVLYLLSLAFAFAMFYLALRLQNPILSWYFLFLSPLFAYFIYLLYRADTVRRFRFLSSYCKWIMLSGILSMVFF